MVATVYDVVGLGNAIVDVISQQDDAFLARWRKGFFPLLLWGQHILLGIQSLVSAGPACPASR